jgi:hypothetical protein
MAKPGSTQVITHTAQHRLNAVANVRRPAAGRRDGAIAAPPNRQSRSEYGLLIAAAPRDAYCVAGMHDFWGAQ